MNENRILLSRKRWIPADREIFEVGALIYYSTEHKALHIPGIRRSGSAAKLVFLIKRPWLGWSKWIRTWYRKIWWWSSESRRICIFIWASHSGPNAIFLTLTVGVLGFAGLLVFLGVGSRVNLANASSSDGRGDGSRLSLLLFFGVNLGLGLVSEVWRDGVRGRVVGFEPMSRFSKSLTLTTDKRTVNIFIDEFIL